SEPMTRVVSLVNELQVEPVFVANSIATLFPIRAGSTLMRIVAMLLLDGLTVMTLVPTVNRTALFVLPMADAALVLVVITTGAAPMMALLTTLSKVWPWPPGAGTPVTLTFTGPFTASAATT